MGMFRPEIPVRAKGARRKHLANSRQSKTAAHRVLDFEAAFEELDIRVMENQQLTPRPEVSDANWSNRILILALGGIFFLTLYPFRFDFHTPAAVSSPLLLGKGFKNAGFYDAFLNVLLFMPFGLGLAERLRERGRSRSSALVIVLIAGALLSYTIEFLQIYIPERDSGWEDVFTNASGSVAGFLMFELFGDMLLPTLSALERGLSVLLEGWRAALVLLLYFGLWFAASVPLQRATGLSNWNPQSLLVIGNDAGGKDAWSGQIRLVQIGDRAISSDQAKRVLAADGVDVTVPRLRASFDFSSLTPLHDQLNFLPDLLWTPRIPENIAMNPPMLDGSSWLSSKVNVSELVDDLRRSNQFTIRVVCAPARTNGVDARILSISQPAGLADLTMRQEGTELVLWFRNGISAKRSQLAWHIPDVFKVAETRNIVYSYDGSNLSLYIDGKLQPTRYRLGPGAALAVFLRRVRPSELGGYNYIYYALTFFPAGALLGIATRRFPAKGFAGCAALGVAILVVPLLLELVLIHVSGRWFSPVNVLLAIGFTMGGCLWINADRRSIHSVWQRS